MANQKYNNYERLYDLRRLRSVTEMAKEIARMSRQLNQRFYRLEKAGVGLNETAYRYAQNETGKDKPRYTTSVNKLSKMNLNDLYRLGLELNKKIVSDTSSIKGLKRVEDRRINESVKALKNTLGVKDIDEEKFKEFLMAGGSELMNSKYMDSNQVIDDWLVLTQNGNISTKEFIREFKRFKKVTKTTYSRLQKNWFRANQRKLQKRKTAQPRAQMKNTSGRVKKRRK